MDAAVCLLPSPLLGPACWRPVEALLTARTGWAVAGVARPRHAPRAGADVLGTFLAAIPQDRDVVLIPHSNAGLFVPSLAALRQVAGYVFVDAGLPGSSGAGPTAGSAQDGPATGSARRVPMIAPEFHRMLAGKADSDGMLPPWTRWWDGEDLSALFPDARTREEVEREQHRLPLSYFGESVPVPDGWPDRPGAYLAFGETYAEERSAAAARGWPVATLAGEHLHMLVNPPQVADAIVELISAMAIS